MLASFKITTMHYSIFWLKLTLFSNMLYNVCVKEVSIVNVCFPCNPGSPSVWNNKQVAYGVDTVY